MASILPLPATVGVEDFAIYSEEAEILSPHSRDQACSSPPAPPLSSALTPDSQDYNYSGNIYDDYAASRSVSAHEDEYATEEDDTRLHAPDQLHSTRSSISSFPGSILPDSQHHRLSTPTKSPNLNAHAEILHHGRSGSLSYKIRSPASRLRDVDRSAALDRDHGSGFRHPSSVRAMQMRDEELFDSDVDNVAQHRRSGSRTSGFSHRSTNSSPTKRTSRSNHSTPRKIISPSKLKKEFPLILLHCSLLPPTLALKSQITDEALLEEVLPAEYWRRWKILQDKVGEDNEVRTRGVLIPHPRDDYDVLEERLLESLELQRPRLRKGHYINADVDSGLGTESERDTENESDIEGQLTKPTTKTPKCSDCGKRVPQEVDVDRKWEVKVYAANGLMRAGAWMAAWADMEKVDIEVSVWMPETVRRDIDARLKELGVVGEENMHQQYDETLDSTEREHRQREIYGHDSHTQEKVDGLSDEQPEAVPPPHIQQDHFLRPEDLHPQMDMQTLLSNYLRGLIQDRRNVFMILMSFLVLFLALSKPQTTNQEVTQPSVSASQEASITMTSVSTLTSTEVVTATVTSTTTSGVASEIHSSNPPTTMNTVDQTIPASVTYVAETTSAQLAEEMELIGIRETNDGATFLTASTFAEEATEAAPKEARAAAQDAEPALLDQVVQLLGVDDGMLE